MDSVAAVACIVAILAWGAGGVVDKLGVRASDPYAAVLVRLVFSTLMVLAFCVATGRARVALELSPRAYLFLAISGLLGSVVGQVAYFVAIKHAPVGQVVPITATYPVVAFLLAILVLREAPSLPRLAGVVLVVVGLMLVSGSKPAPQPQQQSQTATDTTERLPGQGD